MWSNKIIIVLSLISMATAKYAYEKEQESDESGDPERYSSKKLNTSRTPTTTGRSANGGMVVEKFVESLMTSERYLKMVETLDKKFNHLDSTFHERSNTIQKYLAEILRTLKSSPADMLENRLRALKVDLDTLKSTLSERMEHPNMREGGDYHIDTNLDNRLLFLESQAKTILSNVETIAGIMTEVKNRQYSRLTAKSEPIGTVDASSLVSEFRRALQEHKSVKKCDCKMMGRTDRSERYPTDCHEIHMQGFNVSGIYKIKPDDMEAFYVLCDLNTAGGGWTVLQNRFDGSQDFYKGWSDYKHGFGNLAGEFWLGLEKISYLTNQKLYELRIELESQRGQEAFAGYSVFTIAPEHEGYRISTLGSFYGTAGDSLSYHAGQKFSTPDVDNDEWREGSCATEHGGAWWYKECDKSNLNGKFTLTSDENQGQSIYWISFKEPSIPLTKTKILIRPLPASRPIDLGTNPKKILDGSKRRLPSDKLKGGRGKDVKNSFEMSRARAPPYRYEDNVHSDAFFPNYV